MSDKVKNVNENNLKAFANCVKADLLAEAATRQSSDDAVKAELNQALQDETTARTNADTAISQDLDAEAATRAAQTAALDKRINDLDVSNITGNGFIKSISQTNGKIAATTSTAAQLTTLTVSTTPTISSTSTDAARGQDIYKAINTDVPAYMKLKKSDSVGSHTIPNILKWLGFGSQFPVIASVPVNNSSEFASQNVTITFTGIEAGSKTFASYYSSAMQSGSVTKGSPFFSATVKITIKREYLKKLLSDCGYLNTVEDVTQYIFENAPTIDVSRPGARNLASSLGTDVYKFIKNISVSSLSYEKYDSSTFTLTGACTITFDGDELYSYFSGYNYSEVGKQFSFQQESLNGMPNIYGGMSVDYTYTSYSGGWSRDIELNSLTISYPNNINVSLGTLLVSINTF